MCRTFVPVVPGSSSDLTVGVDGERCIEFMDLLKARLHIFLEFSLDILEACQDRSKELKLTV